MAQIQPDTLPRKEWDGDQAYPLDMLGAAAEGPAAPSAVLPPRPESAAPAEPPASPGIHPSRPHSELLMFRFIIERELDWCRRVAQVAQWPRLGPFMATISRLGNGGFWFSLILAIGLFGGPDGYLVGTLMLTAGFVTLLAYKLCKAAIPRPRPCEVWNDFEIREPPLDRWSFPSGHTMHAVCFSVVALNYYPSLIWIVVPFTSLVMASRVMLGLHYPTDVLAGSICGALIGWASLGLVGF